MKNFCSSKIPFRMKKPWSGRYLQLISEYIKNYKLKKKKDNPQKNEEKRSRNFKRQQISKKHTKRYWSSLIIRKSK